MESLAQKSMIGHSDFVPLEKGMGGSGDAYGLNPNFNPYAAQSQNMTKKSYQSLGDTSGLVLATENSTMKPTKPPIGPGGASPSPFRRKGSKQSYGGGSQNTLDFIDNMINQDVIPGGKSTLDDSGFKLPDYEGMQTSLMKGSATKFGGTQGTQGSLDVQALNEKQEHRLDKMQIEVDNLLNM